MTARTTCTFALKRGPEVENLFIAIEPYDESLGILVAGLLCFGLPKDVTEEKAKEIEDFLNDNLTSISYTLYDYGD
jgi:hypothetical protein